MSNLRRIDPDAGVLVRSYAVTHPPGLDIAERALPRWHQLAYAARGVMEVLTADGRWVVPPQRAVWIPAGARHALHMTGRVTVRTLFFQRSPEACGATPQPSGCRALAVSPLLRELVLEVCRCGVLRSAVAREARLAAVVLDRIALLPDAPLVLPLPVEPRARRLAERILAQPAAPLADSLCAAPASRRTLERLFLTQTHMTLGQWHRRARLAAALKLLAHGHGPTRVALDVGYRSPSAFVSAFRRALGRTPGRYFEAGEGAS